MTAAFSSTLPDAPGFMSMSTITDARCSKPHSHLANRGEFAMREMGTRNVPNGEIEWGLTLPMCTKLQES